MFINSDTQHAAQIFYGTVSSSGIQFTLSVGPRRYTIKLKSMNSHSSSKHGAHKLSKIGFFREKKNGYDDSFDVAKCLLQIEILHRLHMHATCSVLPSNISIPWIRIERKLDIKDHDILWQIDLKRKEKNNMCFLIGLFKHILSHCSSRKNKRKTYFFC